jgi:hypothetical protein
MELQFLVELLDLTQGGNGVESMKDNIDYITRLLFSNITAGPVKDLKRSKEAKFYGVAHAKSLLVDGSGKALPLTFDNSTESGEFEINSLVPLKVERRSPEDLKILGLYRKFGVSSKAKLTYIAHGDKIVLRAVHLGKEIGEETTRFAKALVKILRGGSEAEADDDELKPDVKDAPKLDEPTQKSEPKKAPPKREPAKAEKAKAKK